MVEDSHSSPRKVKSCPGIYGTKVHKQIAKDGILSLNHAEKCLVNARLLLVAQNHSFEQNDVISEIEEKASSEVSSLLVVHRSFARNAFLKVNERIVFARCAFCNWRM